MLQREVERLGVGCLHLAIQAPGDRKPRTKGVSRRSERVGSRGVSSTIAEWQGIPAREARGRAESQDTCTAGCRCRKAELALLIEDIDQALTEVIVVNTGTSTNRRLRIGRPRDCQARSKIVLRSCVEPGLAVKLARRCEAQVRLINLSLKGGRFTLQVPGMRINRRLDFLSPRLPRRLEIRVPHACRDRQIRQDTP